MELVNKTHYWIENIEHCVSFDSWDQFMGYGMGLRANWSHLSLLTWGCRQEKSIFDFQLVYIDLNGDKRDRKANLPVFGTHRFELKCVTIRVKDADVPTIKKWLVESNPDLWGMKALTEKVESQ